jgi:hypothetical protein
MIVVLHIKRILEDVVQNVGYEETPNVFLVDGNRDTRKRYLAQTEYRCILRLIFDSGPCQKKALFFDTAESKTPCQKRKGHF